MSIIRANIRSVRTETKQFFYCFRAIFERQNIKKISRDIIDGFGVFFLLFSYFVDKSVIVLVVVLKMPKRSKYDPFHAIPLAFLSLSLQRHGFFRYLTWDDVYAKRYEPPHRPVLKSDDDVSQFDTRFTKQIPVDSPDDNMLSESANQIFLVESISMRIIDV